jgi:heat-inducible transcriptional repressor
MLDARSRTLLKTLIERYIAEGQPVGSRTLSRFSGLEISPATIRNVMADLEEAGLIVSPHASAGRIPTIPGYRLFVDSLLTARPLEQKQLATIGETLKHPAPAKELAAQASQLLSELTHFAGIVAAPRRQMPTVRQIEFVPIADKRILLILVTTDGEVQNRLLFTERIWKANDLLEAANYMNRHFSGLTLEEIRQRLSAELSRLREDMQQLMQKAVEVGADALEAGDDCLISGEKNLIDAEQSASLSRLKELFGLFEQRTSLMGLLDHARRASGIRIFIGGESGPTDALDGYSLIAAPYTVDGQVVGSLGVIGPTRMAYDEIVPVVDITARLFSSALQRVLSDAP